MIPATYELVDTTNTPACFAAGTYLAIKGFINEMCCVNKIDIKQVIITGGDSLRFKDIAKSYNVVPNLINKAMAMLIKEKG